MTTIEKTAVTIDQTVLDKLDKGGRLLNAVLRAPTPRPGRFGFRGDIALEFQPQLADEKRPPEFSLEQVLTFAEAGAPTLPVLVGYLHSFAYLEKLAEVLQPILSPTGLYILFCNNIDILAKYRVKIGEITFVVLPLDESTVWKEMLDLTGVDKNDIKKMGTAEKLDHVLDAALRTKVEGEAITFEQGLERMGPVRNRNENRPV
jgi:hypothetical protein